MLAHSLAKYSGDSVENCIRCNNTLGWVNSNIYGLHAFPVSLNMIIDHVSGEMFKFTQLAVSKWQIWRRRRRRWWLLRIDKKGSPWLNNKINHKCHVEQEKWYDWWVLLNYNIRRSKAENYIISIWIRGFDRILWMGGCDLVPILLVFFWNFQTKNMSQNSKQNAYHLNCEQWHDNSSIWLSEHSLCGHIVSITKTLTYMQISYSIHICCKRLPKKENDMTWNPTKTITMKNEPYILCKPSFRECIQFPHAEKWIEANGL